MTSNGKTWVNRRKPFELFLKTNGVFLFHLELHRLCVTIDRKGTERWDEPVFFRWREDFRWFFFRLRRLVVTADRRMKL